MHVHTVGMKGERKRRKGRREGRGMVWGGDPKRKSEALSNHLSSVCLPQKRFDKNADQG